MYSSPFVSFFFPVTLMAVIAVFTVSNLLVYKDITSLYRNAIERINRNLHEEVSMHKKYNINYSLGALKVKYEETIELVSHDYKRVITLLILAFFTNFCVIFMSAAWMSESAHIEFLGTVVELSDNAKHSLFGGTTASLIFTALSSRYTQAFKYYHG